MQRRDLLRAIAAPANHINGQRVIDRIFRAVTGREHPVFLWA